VSGGEASPVALVTGASRGIGHAIAAALLARGGRVAVTGRDAERLEEAALGLGAAERVLPIAGNAADPDALTLTVELPS